MSASQKKAASIPSEARLDDACLQDMDHFVKTLAGIKAKGVRPDLIASIVSNYAPKWLPELSPDAPTAGTDASSPRSSVAAWVKKRFLVETLAGILPPEREAAAPGFVLRLLRAASMVEADPVCMTELEARAARRLEEATLSDIMIPAFNHTCGTTLDVGLVLRLVRRFLALDEAARSGSGMAKVAKLVDSYLAEAALEAGLTVAEFEELAHALPAHARATDDGLYRAIDTYFKTHPSTTKQDRKSLCRLIDTRKLSSDASLHAAHNERLPVRTVLQALFTENMKLNRIADWSGSFRGPHSPNLALDLPGRCPSKREAVAQQQEIRRLREDVARLHAQCQSLQTQIERLTEKKKKSFFRWSSLFFPSADVVEQYEHEVGAQSRTPSDTKRVRTEQKRAIPKWRNSMS